MSKIMIIATLLILLFVSCNEAPLPNELKGRITAINKSSICGGHFVKINGRPPIVSYDLPSKLYKMNWEEVTVYLTSNSSCLVYPVADSIKMNSDIHKINKNEYTTE